MEEKKSEYIQAPIETVTYDGKIWGAPESIGRGLPLLPHRQGQDPAHDMAGGLHAGQGPGRDRLSGRALRGPDVRLPRAAVRGRRHGALRGRQEGDDRLARERQGAAVHGRRAQGRRRAEGRHHLHGARVARGLPDRQVRVHAQLALRLRAQPEGQAKVKGKFEVMPFPEFEGGGKAGILGGHNSVISVYSKNPGAALKLVDFIGSPEIQKAYAAQFSLSPRQGGGLQRRGRARRRCRSRTSSSRRSRRPRPVRCRRSTRRSRRRSTRTSTRALSGQTTPEDAITQAQADIEKALSTF